MKKLILLTAISSLLLAGNSDRLQVNLNTDENGNTNPDLFIPIYWNDSMFSGVGYFSSSSYEAAPLSFIQNSRIGTTTDEKRLKLNLLTYEYKSDKVTYALGAEIEKVDINKKEFGYFEYDSDIIATENSVDIKLIKPNINADITYKTNNLLLRLGIILSPSTTLDVKQTTIFQPLVSTTGESDSTTTQNLSYEIKLKTAYKVSPLMTLHLQSSYSVLPMKYDLAVLNDALSDFTTQTIEIEEKSTSNVLKVAFNLETFSELSPTIGYGVQSVSIRDLVEYQTTKLDNKIWTIGFEGRF